jgi:hypothetical protein
MKIPPVWVDVGGYMGNPICDSRPNIGLFTHTGHAPDAELAPGGELDIVARFPDGTMKIANFSEIG